MQQFSSIDQLRRKITSMGYTMGYPYTRDGHNERYAHIQVLKGTDVAAVITIEAVAPLHGPYKLESPE